MTPYNVSRIARIVRYSSAENTCDIKYIDSIENDPIMTVTAPQPLGMGATGVFVEPEVNSLVLVTETFMGRPYIISYLPEGFFSQAGTQNNELSLSFDYVSKPADLKPGEVTLKGFDTTSVVFRKSGNIDTRFGSSFHRYDSRDIVTLSADSEYVSLSSGYSVSGNIKREQSRTEKLSIQDKLSGSDFDDLLRTVGRRPDLSINLKTDTGLRNTSAKRNPPYVEKRAVTYEFGRDFGAGNPEYERQLFDGKLNTIVTLDTQRQGARTDALGLGPLQHNLLEESIIGTVVDTYGNVLDINRNPIDLSSVASAEDEFEETINLSRRSIKMHKELNSRKQNSNIQPDRVEAYFEDGPLINADHSRWFMDVDAEGQTKINMPASSSRGNIPVHARYLASAYFDFDTPEDRTLYRLRKDVGSSQQIDIVHKSYLLGKELGIPIEGAPDSKDSAFVWNMPYHDFRFLDVLDRSSFFYPGNIIGGPLGLPRKLKLTERLSGIDLSVITPQTILTGTSLSNSKGNSNAGGRSLHMNLDGSAEISLGMDQIDNKSLCLDTAGSVLGRLGKDSKGNSLVLGTDGNAIISMGSGSRFDSDSPSGADLQIFIESSNGGITSVQVIDGNIVIKSAPDKNLILDSGGNLILNAAKNVLVGGERLFTFGKYSFDGKTIAGEREIQRSGNKDI